MKRHVQRGAMLSQSQCHPQLFAVIGATASGKTDFSVALARAIGGEILTVDSMQVYRQMDVGTAKPTAAERAGVAHHLIDVVDPDETFTAARFVEMADGVIADASARGVPLIAVGGTPLYFKVLFEGMFSGPGEDPAVRTRLRTMPSAELHRRLAVADPLAAARIHVNDARRLVRALEVLELTGKPISTLQTDWDSAQPRHEAIWVGLSWEKDALNRRINARVKSMIAAGWVDEVRRLHARYPNLSKTAGEATGYRELTEHIQGRLSLDDAVEQIKIATRQLARRQMKWFKRFRNVVWLPGERSIEDNIQKIVAHTSPPAPRR